MKNPNRYLSISICRILLFTVVGFVALFQINCSGVVTTLDQYSGDMLYESAVESNGDLLSYTPGIQLEVDKHLETEEERRKFHAFQQKLITKLIRENPGFVDEFKKKMHSNDREQINEALSNAGALVEEELQVFTGKSEITAQNVVKEVLDENNDPK